MSARTGSSLLSKIALSLCAVILGCGSSFAQYKENVIHAFNVGPDGANIRAVIPDGHGDLYGTTTRGGANDQGTLFKLTHAAGGWQETQLYSFPPGGDTMPFPGTSLVHDAAGNFYGTSPDDGLLNCQSEGYPNGCGTVWELSHTSQGWTRTILYSFTGQGDGEGPDGLVIDTAGNLYGVSAGTGSAGTVFNLSFDGTKWVFATLYTFTGGADGGEPQALVLDSSGNLFGSTYEGGISNPDVCFDSYDGNSGCGVVFELLPSSNGWKESLLYSFLGGNDGGNPYGRIALDPQGNIFGIAGAGANLTGVLFEVSHSSGGWTESVPYTFGYVLPSAGVISDGTGNIFGATQWGGLTTCSPACGTVFELSPVSGGWAYNTIYSYTGAFDGQNPQSPPVLDGKGNLFLSSYSRQSGLSIALALSPKTGGGYATSVLHDFPSSADGVLPYGSLVRDSSGNLYGTTAEGGTHGWGTVYELLPSGGTWKEKILYSFQGTADGAFPISGLAFDSAGNLYGATQYGGKPSCTGGCGTIFKLAPSANGKWDFSLLHTFLNTADGSNPPAGIIVDAAGNVYGTSLNGNHTTNCFTGCGLVFRLSPTGSGEWHFSTLYAFTGGKDGGVPATGTIAMDPSGRLYGITRRGGNNGYGGIYQLSLPLQSAGSQWHEAVLYNNGQSEDSHGTLTLDQAGNLYDTTSGGGTFSNGTVFELSKSGGIWTKTVIYNFGSGNGDGGNPDGGVVFDPAGNLYGVNNTTAYELSPNGSTWKETNLFSFGFLYQSPAITLAIDPSGDLFGTIPLESGSGSDLVYELTP